MAVTCDLSLQTENVPRLLGESDLSRQLTEASAKWWQVIAIEE